MKAPHFIAICYIQDVQTKNKLVWLLFVLLATVFCFIFFTDKNRYFTPNNQINFMKVEVGKSLLDLEMAKTPHEWEKGLSGRNFLSQNSGMIFIFPESEIRSFWMKDTLIPLDIIWINENRIVGIDHMFPELGISLARLKRYLSPSPVDWVIEVPLNWAQNNNIKIGDTIKIVP